VQLSIHRATGIALAIVLGALLMTPSAGFSQPDLVVDALGDPPATGLPGDSFVATASVRNQGSAPSGVSTTKFYLLSTTGPTKKNLKGVQNVPILAPGAGSAPGVTVSIYSDTVPGTYHLQACADGGDTIPEAAEGNNCLATTGTITVQDLPDLVVTAISDPPGSLPQGQSFPATDTVQNTGAVASGPSSVKYYLVSSVDGSRTDLKGTQSVPALAPTQAFTDETTLTVREETVPGPYRLQACADSAKAVTEKDEDDNCLTSAGDVQVTPQPDLVVKKVTVTGAPLSVGPGDALAIKTVVKNKGLAAAATSALKFVLMDTSTAATKNLKGTQAVPGVPQGTKQKLETTVTVYGDTPPGVYTVQACADSEKIIPESAEGNNCTTAPGTITVAGTPLSTADLAVKTVTEPPVTALPGDSFEVTAVVGNTGTESSPATTTKFYLLSESGTTRKNLKGVQSIAELAAGAEVEAPVAVALYSDTVAGIYFLQACADGKEELAEADEGDNCLTSAGAVEVTAPADLIVKSVTVANAPVMVTAGDTIAITAGVKNKGLGDAGASTTKFYLVTTPGAAPVKNLNGTQAVPPVPHGTKQTLQTTVGVFSDTPPGTYFVLACADSGKVVAETDDDNNCGTSAGTVTVE